MKLFDLDCDYENAEVVITPVPWDVTTSYGGGTRFGPKAIFHASEQIDSFSLDTPEDFEHKYFIRELPEDILKNSERLRKAAKHVVEHDLNKESDHQLLKEVNTASNDLNSWVKEQTEKSIQEGKIPATLGGDHSIPYGAIEAVANKFSNDYSVLHLDAHHDLREAYQGFTHSHASIFYNIMQSDFAPKKLVQLGIRDFCKEEFDMAKDHEDIEVYYDRIVKERMGIHGETWGTIANEINDKLTENVYISVDIDGFDPKLCPNTGTPVPGGIDFDPFCQLLRLIVSSGKKIIGFDLVEVSPGENQGDDEWDANVGMRVLFELCKYASLSSKS